MQELRNFELGLGSQRAQLGMQTTLGFAQQQNAFDQSLMEFQKSLQQNAWQTRQGFMFGGGAQAAAGVGSTEHRTGTMTATPSIMSNIGQTIGVLQQGVDLAKSVSPSGGIKSPGSSGGAGLNGMQWPF